jgi:serine/threonine protein kinase
VISSEITTNDSSKDNCASGARDGESMIAHIVSANADNYPQLNTVEYDTLEYVHLCRFIHRDIKPIAFRACN